MEGEVVNVITCHGLLEMGVGVFLFRGGGVNCALV
jgi:hypothetical protein